jgi:hypothetical protein
MMVTMMMVKNQQMSLLSRAQLHLRLDSRPAGAMQSQCQ